MQFKSLVKKIMRYMRGGYKPKEFWEQWSDTFIQDKWQVQTHTQHLWILQKVEKLKQKKILEVGCGFGRNIKFLIDNGFNPGRITAVDISPKMIKKARQYINNKDVKLLVADACKLPFKNDAFDLVLVHGVFMHIKPQYIEITIKEALRVTRNVLLNIEQNYPPDEESREYTFAHDYKKIYKKYNVLIKEYISNKKDGLDYFYVKVR